MIVCFSLIESPFPSYQWEIFVSEESFISFESKLEKLLIDNGKINKDSLANKLLTFLQQIKTITGKQPIIYTSTNFANKYLTHSWTVAVYIICKKDRLLI